MASSTLNRGAAQCSNCSRPATATCAGCKLSPPGTLTSIPQTTYYCSSACQTAAWPSHKSACKALQVRRSLYRAADTVQKAFFVYREKVFEKLFTKVTEKDGILYLTEGNYSPDDVLIPFPEDLVKTENDKQAVLTHLTCTDALGWMHNLIDMMLEGFHAHLEEITLQLKNHRRFTMVVSDEGPGQIDSTTGPHEVLKIILPSGETFAWDIGSAQYGYHKPLVPWADFYKLRVDYIRYVKPFGSVQYALEEEWCKGQVRDMTHFGKVETLGVNVVEGLLIAVYCYNRQFTTVFDGAVKEWLDKVGWAEGFSKMLKLPVDVFDKKQEELVEFIEQKLQEFKDYLIRKGELRMRFGEAAKLPVNQGLGDLMTKVEAMASREGKSAEEVLRTLVGKTRGEKNKVGETQAEGAKQEGSKVGNIRIGGNKARRAKAKKSKTGESKAQDTPGRNTQAKDTNAQGD